MKRLKFKDAYVFVSDNYDDIEICNRIISWAQHRLGYLLPHSRFTEWESAIEIADWLEVDGEWQEVGVEKKDEGKVKPLIMINWDEIDKECGLK